MTETVSFSLSDGELTVRDEAGSGELVADVDEDASLTPATDAWFDVPVDDAVSLETAVMEVRGAPSTQIRRVSGEHCGTLTEGEFSLTGETYVDLTASVKVLVYVDGEVTGRFIGDPGTPESLFLRFDDPATVVVGARSHHESPVGTMTVTDDPEDLMTAASYLGSSIKEWSAERSWPTLRGHPPAIETGDELHVPESLSIPDTDVTVAVPPNTSDVLRVTPLAHYFGAAVVPADQAALRLGGQPVEPLGTGAELEQSVDELLARAVLLDSLVRIGGYYSLPRYEYDALAPELPFYPPELYDVPIHRQLLEYLEVPFETLRPYTQTWHAVGTLRPRAADAAAVPYLLRTLARVHVTEDGIPRTERPVGPEKPVELSTNAAVPHNVASLPPAARERAAEHAERPSEDAEVLFIGWEPPEQDWFAAVDWDRFELEGEPTAAYRGTVTRAELRSLFADPYVHVHYGDDVSQRGFVCSDGVLAFEDCPEGAVGSISFQWGDPDTAPLTGVLGTASVACLTDGCLSMAETRELAAYLVLGRSVASSVELADIDGVRYLGDPLLPVARRLSGYCPTVASIEREGDDRFRLTVELVTDERNLIGRVSNSRLGKLSDTHQLEGTRTRSEPLSSAELVEVMRTDSIFRSERRPASESRPPVPDIDGDPLSE